MLQLLSLLTVISLALGLCVSQESYAKSTVKKIKKAAAITNSKAVKTEKKFSELDGNRKDRFDGNDLHGVPFVGRVLQNR